MMLLLTGATGLVGSALLRRLVAEGEQVRCLVRDPRRLGAQRVRVQIALGDLTDPPPFRNALRGVHTVVHLAASIRDQPRGSIEELNGIATWRMVQAAERAGVERFVFFSVLDASTHHRARFSRAKALAEQAVVEASLHSTVFAPSIVYAPGDPWLTLIERLSLLTGLPASHSPGHPYREALRPRFRRMAGWAEPPPRCLRGRWRSSPSIRRGESAGGMSRQPPRAPPGQAPAHSGSGTTLLPAVGRCSLRFPGAGARCRLCGLPPHGDGQGWSRGTLGHTTCWRKDDCPGRIDVGGVRHAEGSDPSRSGRAGPSSGENCVGAWRAGARRGYREADMKPRVLIVDDSLTVRMDIGEALQSHRQAVVHDED